jgi:hypothetical protein
MAEPKDKDKKTKIPYEPPRLFNLGGGVAYAQTPCNPGGSPGAGACKEGVAAGSNYCQAGSLAVGQCKRGTSPI